MGSLHSDNDYDEPGFWQELLAWTLTFAVCLTILVAWTLAIWKLCDLLKPWLC